RLDNIQMCIESVIREGIPGDLIEAGVWRGGTTIFMKGVLDTLGDTSRNLWLADSFEGLPSPDADRYPIEAKAHNSKVMRDVFQHFAVELADVRENFRRFGVLDKRVRFLKGWFKDTLPRAPIHAFSVIRLDGDYYESTMDCLLNLYPKLSRGGYLVVDDYGQDDWTYCRQAVDEVRRNNNIVEPIIRGDSTCYYWRRATWLSCKTFFWNTD